MAVTREGIGLCGCWQVMAVERTSHDTTQPNAAPSSDIGLYANSLTVDTLKSWGEQQTFSTVWPLVQR